MTIATRDLPVPKALELPALGGLSEEQVRGASCIWCNLLLTVETAVDLGERRHRRLDGHYLSFPRACGPCTHKAALGALHDHAPRCTGCCTSAGECETGVALNRLIREARR